MNRADLLHSALKDGKPRTRSEIFFEAGQFFLTNNAASELRARGLEVTHEVVDGEHVYSLNTDAGSMHEGGSASVLSEGLSPTPQSGPGNTLLTDADGPGPDQLSLEDSVDVA